MDDLSTQVMTMAEMRKALRDARKEHIRPASKLGKADLVNELRSYHAKSQAKAESIPTPKPSKKKAAEPEIVSGRLAPAQSTSPTVHEKRMAALEKAREARKRNLAAKASGSEPTAPSTKGAEKKKSQVQPVSQKYNDLFIY